MAHGWLHSDGSAPYIAASQLLGNKTKEVARMLKAIYAQESKDAALEKASAVTQHLREMKLPKAADLIDERIGETLT